MPKINKTILEQLKRYLTLDEQARILNDPNLQERMASISASLIAAYQLPKPQNIYRPRFYFGRLLGLFPEAQRRHLHVDEQFLDVFRNSIKPPS